MRHERDAWQSTTVHVRLADDEAETQRIACAAGALARITHPGVVELVAADEGRIATRWVGPDLASLSLSFDLREVAGLGAVTATSLADLHSLGWEHCAVEAAHLLVGADGRPIWCGFGRCRRGGDGRSDVADLSALLASLLGDGSGDRRVEKLVRGALADASRGKLDAAGLARRLADPRIGAQLPDFAVADRPSPSPSPSPVAPAPPPGSAGGPAPDGPPGAAGPDGDPPPPTSPEPAGGRRLAVARAGRRPAGGRRGRRATVAWGSVAALSLAALAVSVVHLPGRSTSTCPAVDMGCGPVATSGGVLSSGGQRFALGGPGGIVVVGRWGCGPLATPALLDGATGRIWVWDRWASQGADVAARQVAEVAGASSLSVRPGSACDALVVDRRGHPAAVVDTEAAR